jgi:ankyrin repeat protein
LEVVRTLDSLGADVNTPTSEGAPPLLVAAQNGHLEVMRTLASRGADVTGAMVGGRLRL